MLNYRTVHLLHGDTIQRVAARELGDASRWPELVTLNDLRPPYLSGNEHHPGVVAGNVLLWGGAIRIPAPGGESKGVTAAAAFGADVALTDGLITDDGHGDVSLAVGIPNLRQALMLRLNNEIGCLPFHPKYGNSAFRIRGWKSDLNAHLLALRFCEETVLTDPRVKDVANGAVRQVGDAVVVTINALVRDGTALQLQVEI